MSDLYCFGPYSLNPEKRLLSRDGLPAAVGPTALNILLALVERAGKIVSKDDLMNCVWGNAAVGDNRLHVHIHELRKAIGDDCILTKSGIGYRFIAPIRRQPVPATNASAPLPRMRTGNLPLLRGSGAAEAMRFIGRSEELRMLAQCLDKYRLVTLTGPGGVGKTRLAIHAADSSAQLFPDGVWLVELTALNDSSLVPAAVATVLEIKMSRSVAPLLAVARQLARKKLLIVLDNCEHVLAGAASFAEMVLQSAPDVTILATSREPLSCLGEQVLKVPPLALPPDDAAADSLLDMPAVRLFVETAKSADSTLEIEKNGLPAIAKICRRLDGLPLAIEIVASWVAVLGLGALDAELVGSPKSWMRGRNTAHPRHSTLRAALDWSYDLLSPEERTVFRRLAIFTGVFNMESAQVVAAGDDVTAEQVFEHVANLIRKSMLAVVPGSGPQSYRMLETTRAFATEKLDGCTDAPAVRQKHAALVLRTLERATDEWETTSDAIWLRRYGPLLDDLRGALARTMTQDSDDAVALAGASWPLWRELSLLQEGRKWLSNAEAKLRSATPPLLEARLRNGLGDFWKNTGSVRAAHQEFARAAELYRILDARPLLGSVLSRLAFALLALGRTDEAEQTIAESLSLLEHSGCTRTLANAYSVQVCVEALRGRYEKALAIGEKTIRLCEGMGAERTAFVVAANLMECSLQMADVDGAVARGRALVARLSDTFHADVLGFVLGLLVAALTARGDLDEARAAARQAIPLLRDEGMLFGQFDSLALRTTLAGNLPDAARLLGYSDSKYLAFERPREPIEDRAARRALELLLSALSEPEVAHLKREGALLSEDQAIDLALKA